MEAPNLPKRAPLLYIYNLRSYKDANVVHTYIRSPTLSSITTLIIPISVCYCSRLRIVTAYGISTLRVALHLEATPIPLEADCMKFQPFLGWRPASTTHCNQIIMRANFPICKGLRAKNVMTIQ
jgi:hypothetical protein